MDIGIIDTMKDLFVNFIGAVVFSITGFFYAKTGPPDAGPRGSFPAKRPRNRIIWSRPEGTGPARTGGTMLKNYGIVPPETVPPWRLSLAVLSCFLVPPDGQYPGYLDKDTLLTLFLPDDRGGGFQGRWGCSAGWGRRCCAVSAPSGSWR